MSDIVKYEQQGAVAVITLNRPDSMNAFTNELRADLLQALQKARKDDAVRVVVLTGEGRCFSAGADLKADGIDRPISEKLQQEYRPIQEAIAEMPKPLIAAVPGSAAGIGLSVALQCDLLVMADNAFMLSPFTRRRNVRLGSRTRKLVRDTCSSACSSTGAAKPAAMGPKRGRVMGSARSSLAPEVSIILMRPLGSFSMNFSRTRTFTARQWGLV